MYFLQCGVAEAVDQSIDPAACLAVGAVTVIIALVIGQVCHGVDGMHGITADFIHGAVNAGNTGHLTAVVANAMMDTANENPPKLSFTAYAIQKAGFADAAAAWTELNKTA